MLRTLLPTDSQRHSITNVVTDDIERRPFGHPLSIPDDFQSSVELLVHEAVRHPVDGDISQGIPETPTAPSLGGRVTLLTGAMAVGSSFAASLSAAISRNDRLRLLVPHAYAVPTEVASLQDDFGGNVVTFSEGVYVTFRSGHAGPEIVRRALASMIGGYSVAWLFDDGEALYHPVIAAVPIFDGDGFALVARSPAAMRTFLPDIPIPVLH
ncbi:hypothetical protein IM816_16500 [Luteibacter flocculans]|uniref:Uncharacterized protein n=1 Tax=Luteibacter flocculans TaxID=2780091 RepID=A0ABY4T0S9_9GAMM|nr:hypothetical protein [Luteibacter flocculans]URL58176.1 hypothetical protein IM816_16500 [Luteibacter flocculans]